MNTEGANNKIESLYELLISFMIVDGEVEDEELGYIKDFIAEIFGEYDDQDILPIKDIIIKMAENDGVFEENAANLKFLCSKDDLIEIIKYIGKILISDNEVESQEFENFSKLMIFWEVSKDELK